MDNWLPTEPSSEDRKVQMASWTFFGRVHPERIPIKWGQPLSGQLEQSAFGVGADFHVTVYDSQIMVTLNVTKGSPSIDDLRNIALDLARQLTDIVGYATGVSFPRRNHICHVTRFE